MIAVGLMSGTSLDGIDAALVRILPKEKSYEVEVLAFETAVFNPALLNELRAALPPNQGSAARVAGLHRSLGNAFAAAAKSVSAGYEVDFVASHGQTLWHDGAAGVTLQIGDPFAIREAVQATVCFDFRSADCAAGGHGAPLVPYVDALLFGNANEDRVAVNIGGIANLTVLPRGAEPADARAFDSGPGNMLVDAFVRERTGGAFTFDRDGALALRGRIDDSALSAMLGDPYFALPPPKSTGRERFGMQFLQAHGDRVSVLSLEDGAATLAALTATSLADAIRGSSVPGARVLLSGGGTHNRAMIGGLRERLREFTVETTQSLGMDPDAKEAVAFAILGYETLRGRASNVPRVTGARRAVPLGAIAPHNLVQLLNTMEAECRA